MSESFYEKVLSLFFGFSLLLIFVVSTAELLLFYIISQNPLVYSGYVAALISGAFYGILYYSRFRELKNNLYLFIPDSDIAVKNLTVEPLNIEVNDTSLKVCLYYGNGASLTEISRNLGLTHPNPVKRELVKGLVFLLKFYDEHKQKDVKT